MSKPEKSKYGMLIDYEFCTGCKTCIVACKQEYNHKAGSVGGIEVHELIQKLPNGKLYITNIHIQQRPWQGMSLLRVGRLQHHLAH